MTISISGPDDVTRLVTDTIAELGTATSVDGLDESILIDGGKYVARSYRAGGFLAMWMVGAGVVQFYDPHGNLVRTLSVRVTAATRRAAA